LRLGWITGSGERTLRFLVFQKWDFMAWLNTTSRERVEISRPVRIPRFGRISNPDWIIMSAWVSEYGHVD
jgi:hypothetical protein